MRFIVTPGSSPSVFVTITPARSARAFSTGPSVASSSALTRTTCLRASIASTTTPAANSSSPVASMTTSTPSTQISQASRATAGTPSAMAVATSSAESPDPRPLAPTGRKRRLPLRGSVGDRNELDARKRVRADRDASTHVPGSDDRDPDRPPLPCPLLERLVEDDHAGESPRVSLRQTNASA